MRLPLEIRDDASDGKDKGQTVPPSIIVGIILASLLVLIALYVLMITLRGSHTNPKYIPTPFLKKRWQAWKPKTIKYRMFGFDPISPLYNQHPDRRSTANVHTTSDGQTHTEMSEDTVNRNTSVRSVMTLPAYNPSPLPSERLIAREGERAGVDSVVEFPETAEEEEARREEDMQELFQIRQQRRLENEERTQRRRERRAARAAGDWATVERLRVEAQVRINARRAEFMAAPGTPGSSSSDLPPDADAMLAEYRSRNSSRDRRISSVSYADLGLARHDGTRIRADSVESDHRPLLDGAASMGNSRHDLYIPPVPSLHQRNASMGSVMTTDSEAGEVATPYTSNRSGSDPPILTPSATQGSSGSDRDESHPRDNPPEYEDEEAPPYTSPVRHRAPQLPEMRHVPSIEIENATPINSVPATPVER
ncbi:MAG: hypothetical protein Q9222_006739 [Ikaeria aurantiellina]